MGNSRWRLETSINISLLNAKEANFLEQLEIIVSDWGSDIPLSEVIELVPEAVGRVKFVYIPTDISRKEQKDSKFPEVIALNAAARRATGDYIGRIDNDTVVGSDFFCRFQQLHQEGPTETLDMSDAFLFVERKSVPYRVSRSSLPLKQIKGFIKTFQNNFKLESAVDWGREFWWSPVGIMMFHRDIWEATRGYDERLIYWGWMEGDLALRLGQKHKIVEFSKFVGHDFYHLEHYSNLIEYKDRNGAATPRKKNEPRFEGLNYSENEESWGLFKYDIKTNSYQSSTLSKSKLCHILGFSKLVIGVVLLGKDWVINNLSKLLVQGRVSLGAINPLK